MPMNSSSLHCMWSDRKSRLSLTRACEFFFFSQGWTYLVPVWTLFGLEPVPCGPFVPVLNPCLTGVGPWLICGFLRTFGELLVGSLLDRIGFLVHFVIGPSIGIVCVIAVL